MTGLSRRQFVTRVGALAALWGMAPSVLGDRGRSDVSRSAVVDVVGDDSAERRGRSFVPNADGCAG